jgi:hypothetical protein
VVSGYPIAIAKLELLNPDQDARRPPALRLSDGLCLETDYDRQARYQLCHDLPRRGTIVKIIAVRILAAAYWTVAP